MTTRTISEIEKPAQLTTTRWWQIGLQTALAAILAVVVTQFIILSLWPALVVFKPLDSYPRSALFTFVPALGATAVFAWLVKKTNQPEKKFLAVSSIVLLLSFIPDYFLPLPNRTLAGSTAAATMHLIAGIVTVAMIVIGYRRSARKNQE